MNTRRLLIASLSVCALLTASGCAVFSKGRSQMVTVRSVPEGAVASINGTAVGQTPLKVELRRGEVYRIDLEREGFDSKSTLILPVPNEFEKKTFRWGLDYAFGAMTDLSPDDVTVSLRPSIESSPTGDRFANMSAAVLRADAMLASGQLSKAEHKAVVDQVIETYAR